MDGRQRSQKNYVRYVTRFSRMANWPGSAVDCRTPWKRDGSSRVAVFVHFLVYHEHTGSIPARPPLLLSSDHHLMPARPGPTSQEGYPSSSPPSTDTHNDPFNSQGRRYYDNESDNADFGRRDTYASDSSNPGLHDPNFYDQNGNYDPYRELGTELYAAH